MAVNTPIEIQKYLGGIEYPTTKESLVEHARASGAPEEIEQVLEKLPDDEFDSPAVISKAIGSGDELEEAKVIHRRIS
jgi:hypothetical protein